MCQVSCVGVRFGVVRLVGWVRLVKMRVGR